MGIILNGSQIIKITILVIIIALSGCDELFPECDVDCSAELNEVVLTRGEPDDIEVVADFDNLDIITYWYYCDGIAYTFTWGGGISSCSEQCVVETHTFTPSC